MAETEKKRNIGDAAVDSIRGGASNEDALTAVMAEFPEAKTSLASINWYRNKLRTTDKSIPTARAIKKAAKTAAALDS